MSKKGQEVLAIAAAAMATGLKPGTEAYKEETSLCYGALQFLGTATMTGPLGTVKLDRKGKIITMENV